eukprot:TRINITY_DN13047_c0_g1_i3.p1 TRINITY_DN13047_c0_g1~~TRINITY_DN13047_c0_g1_i3.p1  ORF type:complete len:201 (-),score=18.86 TRINITY_DN13047_c0_g1_i3:124-669(-)
MCIRDRTQSTWECSSICNFNTQGSISTMDADRVKFCSKSKIYAASKFGIPVAWSSVWSYCFADQRLENQGLPIGSNEHHNFRCGGWTPHQNDKDPYIEFRSETPRTWVGIVTKGRYPNDPFPHPQWVGGFLIKYSNTGQDDEDDREYRRRYCCEEHVRKAIHGKDPPNLSKAMQSALYHAN